MSEEKYSNKYILASSIVGLFVNAFLVYVITGIAARQEITNKSITTFRSSLPNDMQSKSIFEAGYQQGMKNREQEIEQAYEDGYHQATEDIQCPATGALLPAKNNPEIKKPIVPNK